MPLKHVDQPKAALDQFVQKYRLWLAIPLVVVAALALWSPQNAVFLLIFVLSIWVLIGLIGLCLRATRSILPKSLSHEDKTEIEQAIGGTLFLGGCALAGIVLRGENAISKFVAKSGPAGGSASFIDPTFALLCIIGIWLYTAYRIKK